MKTSTKLLLLLPAALLLAGCTATDVAQPGGTGGDHAGMAFTPAADDNRSEVMVGCLTELGWEGLVVGWDGGVDVSDIPAEQMEKFNEDNVTCADAYPVIPLTDQEIRDLYAAEVENSECLVARGHQMPEPPTEQTFVDTYGTPKQWFAMIGAGPDTMDEEVYKETFIACPPPAWQL
ncbi:hypothetical protein ACFVAJ_18590 [Agromyces sp. NPDC057679]|uniref:hypothetical protein n=1 Tax=Agromyces sp. NPDC057679 TaxID=3346207 RepID=UPI00366EC635